MSKLDEIRSQGRFWYRYLNQGEQWIPKDRQPVAIASMDERWRKNAAAWLVRMSYRIEFAYTVAEIDLLSKPMMVVVGEVDGKPVERLDPNATLGPSEGSMAADALDEERAARARSPEEWIKTTPLYQALRPQTT